MTTLAVAVSVAVVQVFVATPEAEVVLIGAAFAIIAGFAELANGGDDALAAKDGAAAGKTTVVALYVATSFFESSATDEAIVLRDIVGARAGIVVGIKGGNGGESLNFSIDAVPPDTDAVPADVVGVAAVVTFNLFKSFTAGFLNLNSSF